MGRFFAIDPRIRDYPELSPYVYAANNPIFLIDKNGEGPEPPAKSFVGATRQMFIQIVKANGFELPKRKNETNDSYGRRYTITLGNLFEKNVLNVLGLKKNTTRVYPYKYNSEYTVPDAIETSRFEQISNKKILGVFNKVEYALDFDGGLFFEAKFSKNVMFEQEFNPLQFKKQIDALAAVNKATKYIEGGNKEVAAKATNYGAAVLSLIVPSDAVIDEKLIKYATEKKVVVIRHNLEFKESGGYFDDTQGDDLKGGEFRLSEGEYLNPEVIKHTATSRNQGSRRIGTSKGVIAN